MVGNDILSSGDLVAPQSRVSLGFDLRCKILLCLWNPFSYNFESLTQEWTLFPASRERLALHPVLVEHNEGANFGPEPNLGAGATVSSGSNCSIY